MLSEFKKFILRGNVIDLAVAVVVGTAFTAVVNALVKDFITPLIAAFRGHHDFSALHFAWQGSIFGYGDFVNTVVSFLSIAVVVFFFVVQPINKLQNMTGRKKPEATRKCPECLSEIPRAATRCAFCTAKVVPLTK